MEVRLTVIGGKTSKETLVLRLPAVIGRGRDADLTVAHPMISRRHCELYEADGLVMVRDLGSLNGTVVAGQPISDAPLRPNDSFTLGPITFQVDYSDHAAASPALADDDLTEDEPLGELLARERTAATRDDNSLDNFFKQLH